MTPLGPQSTIVMATSSHPPECLGRLQKNIQQQQLRVGPNVGLCGMILWKDLQILGRSREGSEN